MLGKNFRTRQTQASIEVANYNFSKEKLEKTIRKQQFCHCLDIVMPKASDIPQSISSLLSETNYEYYSAHRVPVANLIGEEFLGAFVKNGMFRCVSVGTRIDVENCLAISHPGKLVMSLTKDTFEELGLEGRPSNVYMKKPQRFDVEIDLLASHFVPGKNNYDRTLSRFTQMTGLRFDMIFHWEPNDSATSSRSVFNYFRSWGCPVNVCELGREKCYKRNVVVPQMNWEDGQNDHLADDHVFDNLLEVVGREFVDIHDDENQSDFVSSYCCPPPTEEVEHLTLTRWSGLITPDLLINVWEQLW